MNRTYNYLFILLLFLASCRQDNSLAPELTLYEQEVITYFKEIALGFEFGSASKITRKWTQPMKIYVGGKDPHDLDIELDKIINEINDLVADGFSIEIVQDSSQSNFYLYLGSADGYAAIYPSLSELVKTNWGLFSINYNGDNELNRGKMYVDIYRADLTEQKHLLREEITQSLGLGNDSEKYPDSIFQSSWTRTNSYAPIDSDIIKLLYHPRVTIGLDATEVEEVLQQIFLEE